MKQHNISWCARLCTLILSVLFLSCSAPSVAQSNNLAAGKSFVYSPPPNHPSTISDDDPLKLTDGVTASGRLWVSRQAVGWRYAPRIEMTVDLGSEQPIGSIDISSATGDIVPLPRLVVAYGSNDNKTFARLGILRFPEGIRQPKDYTPLTYTASQIDRSCRYVRFVIFTVGKGLFFADEVHILRSNSAKPLESKYTDINDDLKASMKQARVIDRKSADEFALKGLATQTFTPNLASAEEMDLSWARLAAVNQHSDFRLWRKERYSTLSIHEFPSSSSASPSLKIRTVRGEIKGDSFLITSASRRSETITVRLSSNSIPPYLKIGYCPWTTSISGNQISTAIVYIEPSNGGWSFDIKPGSTLRVWASVNGATAPSGKNSSYLQVSTKTANLGNVPLTIQVSPAPVNLPTVNVGGFDYIDGFGSARHLAPIPTDRFWNLIRDLPCRVEWLHTTNIPFPNPSQFQNGTVVGINFQKVDQWIAETPGVTFRMAFLNAQDTFAGAAFGTPEFNSRLSIWAKAYEQHIKSIDPSAVVGLSLVDEPTSDHQAQVTTAYAKAIKSNSTIQIFIDPFFRDPNRSSVAECLKAADIICLHQTAILKVPSLAKQYFDLIPGKRIWIYETADTPKELDPTDYYRLFSWLGYSLKAEGECYWAFSDMGGELDNWDEESSLIAGYTPLFLGNRLALSLHWEALRDGVWDSQIFKTLEEKSKGTKFESTALALLDKIKEFGSKASGANPWGPDDDSKAADSYRDKALDILEQIGQRGTR